MEVLHKFRTTVGGFNRRDVLSYIESSEEAYQNRITELEWQLKEAEKNLRELSAELETSHNEKGAASAEEAKIRASLEESTRTLGQVRGELSQAETKLAVARNELSRLQIQVEQMEPLARSYEELKERVALVELDAHKKAQATVEEARAQADALRDGTRQWLRGILGQYDRMRQAMGGQMDTLRSLAESLTESDEAVRLMKEWGELE